MNIDHLRYFVKLAEMDTYTEASRALFITQPALSAAIRSLEQELGFPLFERRGRKTRLTRPGQVFFQRAASALTEIENGIAEAHLLESDEPPVIRIGVKTREQAEAISPLVGSFHRSVMPSVRFKVLLCPEGEEALEEALASETIDLAVGYVPLDEYRFANEPLIPGTLTALAHQRSPYAAVPVLTSGDLAQATLVTYHPHAPFGPRVAAWLERENLRAISDYEDNETLASMVRANTGSIALVVESRCDARSYPDLVRRPLERDEEVFGLSVAFVRTPAPAGAVAAFLEFLRDQRRPD